MRTLLGLAAGFATGLLLGLEDGYHLEPIEALQVLSLVAGVAVTLALISVIVDLVGRYEGRR